MTALQDKIATIEAEAARKVEQARREAAALSLLPAPFAEDARVFQTSLNGEMWATVKRQTLADAIATVEAFDLVTAVAMRRKGFAGVYPEGRYTDGEVLHTAPWWIVVDQHGAEVCGYTRIEGTPFRIIAKIPTRLVGGYRKSDARAVKHYRMDFFPHPDLTAAAVRVLVFSPVYPEGPQSGKAQVFMP